MLVKLCAILVSSAVLKLTFRILTAYCPDKMELIGGSKVYLDQTCNSSSKIIKQSVIVDWRMIIKDR